MVEYYFEFGMNDGCGIMYDCGLGECKCIGFCAVLMVVFGGEIICTY